MANELDLEALTRHRACIGAIFLDARVPGWHTRITVEELSLASMRKCLLAQLFGSFRAGIEALGLSEYSSQQFGFRALESDGGRDMRRYARYYAALTAAWKEEIKRRL